MVFRIMAEAVTVVPVADARYIQLANMVLQAKSIYNFSQQNLNLQVGVYSDTFSIGTFNIAILYQYVHYQYDQRQPLIIFRPNTETYFTQIATNTIRVSSIISTDTTIRFYCTVSPTTASGSMACSVAILD